jgi:hypothetical protein
MDGMGVKGQGVYQFMRDPLMALCMCGRAMETPNAAQELHIL